MPARLRHVVQKHTIVLRWNIFFTVFFETLHLKRFEKKGNVFFKICSFNVLNI